MNYSKHNSEMEFLTVENQTLCTTYNDENKECEDGNFTGSEFDEDEENSDLPF